VTANTTCLRIGGVGVGAFDRLHDVVMTFPAGLFRYFTASRRDVNVVFKPAGREVIGVPETVSRLGGVFGNETGRRVAIVTNRHRTMARLQPTTELVLHDVTIHTRFSIVGHVGIAARVHEGIRAYANRHANRDAQCYPRHYSAHTRVNKDSIVFLIHFSGVFVL